MKNLVTKLFAVIFIIILAAGCASSITAPEELQAEQEKEIVAPDDITAGGDMMEDVKKPGM